MEHGDMEHGDIEHGDIEHGDAWITVTSTVNKRGARAMKTNKWVWILVVTLCLVTSAAQAAVSVFEVIPDNALGFAVINRLGKTDAKIAKFVELVDIPMTSTPLETAKMFGGIKEGLDTEGSAALVALPADEPGDRPLLMFVIPVSDYQAFIANFNPEKVTDTISRVRVVNKTVLMANKDGYALVVKANSQDLLESVLACKKSIAEKMPPWQTWVRKSDAIVVISHQGVKQFADKAHAEIEKMMPMFDAMGEQGAQARRPCFSTSSARRRTLIPPSTSPSQGSPSRRPRCRRPRASR